MSLRFAELPAPRLPGYAGAVQAMAAGELHGVLVRGLFPAALMAQAAAALPRRSLAGAAGELLARIFPEDQPYEERLMAALTALAGLPARCMHGRQPATIRVLRPGAGLALHGAKVNRLAACVPLTTPERGGELFVSLPGRRAAELALAPLPGDLLLFDDGRLRHRVARVGGRRARRTIECFAALARDPSGVIYWA